MILIPLSRIRLNSRTAALLPGCGTINLKENQHEEANYLSLARTRRRRNYRHADHAVYADPTRSPSFSYVPPGLPTSHQLSCETCGGVLATLPLREILTQLARVMA
jgi:hypothetical protein